MMLVINVLNGLIYLIYKEIFFCQTVAHLNLLFAFNVKGVFAFIERLIETKEALS